MKQERRLARRGRALERRTADADHGATRREARNHVPQILGSPHRVELVDAAAEAGGRAEVVVGAERDHQRVALVHSLVGRNAAGFRFDRRHPLGEKADAGLREVRVVQPDRVGRRAAEHDIELRVPEDECVVRVDERDAGVLTELGRKHRRELEPAEARTENQNLRPHQPTLNRTVRRRDRQGGRGRVRLSVRKARAGEAGSLPETSGKRSGRGGKHGEGRNRTGDTTVFSRVLYQLSYLAAGRQSSRGRAKKGRPGRCYRAANVLCAAG